MCDFNRSFVSGRCYLLPFLAKVWPALWNPQTGGHDSRRMNIFMKKKIICSASDLTRGLPWPLEALPNVVTETNSGGCGLVEAPGGFAPPVCINLPRREGRKKLSHTLEFDPWESLLRRRFAMFSVCARLPSICWQIVGSGQVPAAFTQVAERTAVCKRQNSKSVCSLPPSVVRGIISASVGEQILVLRVAESSKSHNSKADEEDFEEDYEEEEEEEGLEAEEEWEPSEAGRLCADRPPPSLSLSLRPAFVTAAAAAAAGPWSGDGVENRALLQNMHKQHWRTALTTTTNVIWTGWLMWEVGSDQGGGAGWRRWGWVWPTWPTCCSCSPSTSPPPRRRRAWTPACRRSSAGTSPSATRRTICSSHRAILKTIQRESSASGAVIPQFRQNSCVRLIEIFPAATANINLFVSRLKGNNWIFLSEPSPIMAWPCQ